MTQPLLSSPGIVVSFRRAELGGIVGMCCSRGLTSIYVADIPYGGGVIGSDLPASFTEADVKALANFHKYSRPSWDGESFTYEDLSSPAYRMLVAPAGLVVGITDSPHGYAVMNPASNTPYTAVTMDGIPCDIFIFYNPTAGQLTATLTT